MMKQLIYFSLAFILIFNTSCDKSNIKENIKREKLSIKDYEKHIFFNNNLVGKIKNIKSTMFNVEEKFGENIKRDTTYDFRNPLQFLSLLEDKNSFYKFSENERLLFKKWSYRNNENKETYFYDNRWNLNRIEYVFKETDNNKIEITNGIIEFKFENNKIIHSTTFNQDKIAKSYCQYIYSDDTLIKKVFTDTLGEAWHETVYSFENEVRNSKEYIRDGELWHSIDHDKLGRVLCYEADWDGTVIYSYDSINPFPFEMRRLYKGEIIAKSKILFDNHKNISQVQEIGEDGDIETFYEYKYKYDNIGNWIQKDIYENQELRFMIEREIKYY